MIGSSAALLLIWEGRIAGVSGLLSEATGISSGAGRREAVLFVAGLIGGGAVLRPMLPPAAEPLLASPWWLVALAGLLVGYGTRLGSGCTSGHGVCGLARLSRRSLVATAIFMLAGAVTVFVMRHAWRLG